jgi:hypothetical protein
VDPSGMYKKDFQFLSGVTHTVDISDKMSKTNQRLAEKMYGEAATLTRGMEQSGVLPSKSATAIAGLTGLSSSQAVSGYNPKTGMYNQNIADTRAIFTSQACCKGAAAAVFASNIVHDGHHATQNGLGKLPANSFPSAIPTDPVGLARVNSLVISSERGAIAVQSEFLNAVPGIAENVRDNATSFIQGQTDSDILNRYHNRAPTP